MGVQGRFERTKGIACFIPWFYIGKKRDRHGRVLAFSPKRRAGQLTCELDGSKPSTVE
jgi:hypothetical protein